MILAYLYLTSALRRPPPSLSLLCLLCFFSYYCLATRARQQHNVWYNGLHITGIAVDEATGDVFFSDAAGDRVVHQTNDGLLVHEYDDSGLFSPMQLVYYKEQLYVALSSDNRIAVIDVQRRRVSYSSPSPRLGSCNGIALYASTGDIVALDGWGLILQLWTPGTDDSGDRWSAWSGASNLPANYLSSVAVRSTVAVLSVWVVEPSTQAMYVEVLRRSALDSEFTPYRLNSSYAVMREYGEPPRFALPVIQVCTAQHVKQIINIADR